MGKNYILGLSMNCNSFPSIFPRAVESSQFHNLGIAQYSLNSQHASMFKNSQFTDKEEFDKALYLGKHTGSVIFLCSYKQGKREIDSKNNFPFRKSFANRDWVISCNSQLSKEVIDHFPLRKNTLFTPFGTSKEEHIFCWLLDQIHSKNAATLEEFENDQLHALFKSINEFGMIDILLSDGKNLVIYHDKKGSTPLYGIKSTPPHQEIAIDFEKMGVEIDSMDRNHSFILFTNQSSSVKKQELIRLKPGQMLSVKQTDIIYDSHAKLSEQKADKEKKRSQKKEKNEENGPTIISEIKSFPLPSKKISSKESPIQHFAYSYNRHEKATIYSVVHETTYSYSSPVYLSKHLFRLQPVHDLRQTVISYKLTNSVKGKVYNFSGVFGNHSSMFDVIEPYTKMEIKSEAIVSVNERQEQRWDLLYQQTTVPLIWMPWDRIMLQAYLVPPELPESQLYELSEYAMSFVKVNNYKILDIVNNINNAIYREYEYAPASTTLSTTPYEVFINRKGVCQDFANLFICLARLLNIPARYRVGYIYTGAEYENQAQSDATHAWLELYLPNIGWLGFDPTNGCLETSHHIKVACGRNYRDATPTSGTIYKGGGKEKFNISVQVKILEEYSDSASKTSKKNRDDPKRGKN